MLILGIDQSLRNTGCVIFDTEKQQIIKYGVFTTKLRGIDRLNYYYKLLRDLLDAFSIDMVGFEGYSYGSRGNKSVLAELGGIIRLALSQKGYREEESIFVFAPSVVKKFATGRGTAGKADIMEAVKTKWGFLAPNDHVADAYVIARLVEQKSKSLYRRKLEEV